MSFCPSQCKSSLRDLALSCGFHSFGVAEAVETDASYVKKFANWISSGNAGCLDYMQRYTDLRHDPRKLLPGCRSVIAMAVSYFTGEQQLPGAAYFSEYARGDDYHEVIREIAKPVVESLERQGFAARLCVDTAPVAERYWAVRAGLGFTGRNGLLIIPGCGSAFFLCEILTDAPLPADAPCRLGCGDCRRCIEQCPTHAINEDSTVDARRCLSCLTIEYRGELPRDIDLGNRVYGCDTCRQVCPHSSRQPVTPVARFAMRERLRSITVDDILTMSQPEFSAIFSHSAVKRAKLSGLQRNAYLIKSKL